MAKILNLDDVLEILDFEKDPQAIRFAREYEQLLARAAQVVADKYHVEVGPAQWEGKAFAGCCVAFRPGTTGQPVPSVFVATAADTEGDWE